MYRRVARMAMPHYKVDGILLFKRDELDAWLEQYREEPESKKHSASRQLPLAAHHVPVRLRASR